METDILASIMPFSLLTVFGTISIFVALKIMSKQETILKVFTIELIRNGIDLFVSSKVISLINQQVTLPSLVSTIFSILISLLIYKFGFKLNIISSLTLVGIAFVISTLITMSIGMIMTFIPI